MWRIGIGTPTIRAATSLTQGGLWGGCDAALIGGRNVTVREIRIVSLF
jgi:hypothetical protein